jgi:hypothetical protein
MKEAASTPEGSLDQYHGRHDRIACRGHGGGHRRILLQEEVDQRPRFELIDIE